MLAVLLTAALSMTSMAHAQTENGSASAAEVASPLGPLPGTLVAPKGTGPFPAVLLLAGSGPLDRDETIGPNKPLRDLAEALAAEGIVSLRYDKRTHVYGKPAAGKAITVDDEVTDDALTALQWLRRQASVDSRRVFVAGHSLSALMTPRIAQRDSHVTGVILLAAPAKLDLDVVVMQMRYLSKIQNWSQQDIETNLTPVVKARDELAHADPGHPSVGEVLHAPASYWLDLRDYDPIVTAKKLHTPMLILQGGSDYQVVPQDNFSRWQVAFANDPRVKLIEYPGLSHLFMTAGQPPSPADYFKPDHVDSRVIRDMAAWIKAQPAAP